MALKINKGLGPRYGEPVSRDGPGRKESWKQAKLCGSPPEEKVDAVDAGGPQ